jgi:flagellar biosynthetic protein FliO
VPNPGIDVFRIPAGFMILAAVLLFVLTPVCVAQEADNQPVDQGESSGDSLIDSIGSRMEGESAEEETGDGPGGRTISLGKLFGQLVFALIVTLGTLFLLAWLFKRFMGQRGVSTGGQIQVLSKSYLSAKSSIYVVRVAGKTLVVGEAPGGISLLTTLEEGQLGSYPEGRASIEDHQTQENPQEDFAGHLSKSREQMAGQTLSVRMRDASRGARALAERLGRKH